MRVLHLIDGGPDGRGVRGGCAPVLAACRLLHERSLGDHAVCIIGGAALEAEARAAGLNVIARVEPRLGSPWFARRALRRVVRQSGGPPGAVHAWGPAVARLASRTMVSHNSLALMRGPRTDAVRIRLAPPILTACALDPPPPDRDGARYAARPLGLVTTLSEAARDEWINAGLDPGRVSVAPPPVTPSGSAAERRRIRRAFGLADGEIAVMLLGPGPYADVVRWVFFHGILGMAGVKFTGVVTREAGQFDRGVRYFLSAPAKNRLIVSDWAAAHLLPGMDAAVYEGGGYGPTTGLPARPSVSTMPIALAHAAGVPVVAPEWAGDPRLYPAEAREALLGANSALPELARVLMRLLEAPTLLTRMGGLIRDHIARQNHAAGFAAAVEAIWTRELPAAPRSHQPLTPQVRARRHGVAL